MGRPELNNFMNWAYDWMCDCIAGRIGVGSALESGDGTKACEPDGGEDFAASRVSTRECFESGQVGDLAESPRR